MIWTSLQKLIVSNSYLKQSSKLDYTVRQFIETFYWYFQVCCVLQGTWEGRFIANIKQHNATSWDVSFTVGNIMSCIVEEKEYIYSSLDHDHDQWTILKIILLLIFYFWRFVEADFKKYCFFLNYWFEDSRWEKKIIV